MISDSSAFRDADVTLIHKHFYTFVAFSAALGRASLALLPTVSADFNFVIKQVKPCKSRDVTGCYRQPAYTDSDVTGSRHKMWALLFRCCEHSALQVLWFSAA